MTRKKRYTGRRHRLQSVATFCEKISLAGLQILAGTPPRVWAFTCYFVVRAVAKFWEGA
jgi:hypothetical protein